MLSDIRSTSQMPLPQPFHEIRVGGLESGIEPVCTIPQMPPEDTCDITCLLDISDRRTLNSILEKAGFGQHAMFSGQVSVVSFLDNQRFIPRENAGLRIIRSV